MNYSVNARLPPAAPTRTHGSPLSVSLSRHTIFVASLSPPSSIPPFPLSLYPFPFFYLWSPLSPPAAPKVRRPDFVLERLSDKDPDDEARVRQEQPPGVYRERRQGPPLTRPLALAAMEGPSVRATASFSALSSAGRITRRRVPDGVVYLGSGLVLRHSPMHVLQ